jgi:hypothetical protein
LVAGDCRVDYCWDKILLKVKIKKEKVKKQENEKVENSLIIFLLVVGIVRGSFCGGELVGEL